MGRHRRKKTRTLSPEQLQKMKEGRERAKKERENALKTKERVEMLSELDKRLEDARKSSSSKSNFKIKSRRRRVYSK